jgi:hypothetical protein
MISHMIIFWTLTHASQILLDRLYVALPLLVTARLGDGEPRRTITT